MGKSVSYDVITRVSVFGGFLFSIVMGVMGVVGVERRIIYKLFYLLQIYGSW